MLNLASTFCFSWLSLTPFWLARERGVPPGSFYLGWESRFPTGPSFTFEMKRVPCSCWEVVGVWFTTRPLLPPSWLGGAGVPLPKMSPLTHGGRCPITIGSDKNPDSSVVGGLVGVVVHILHVVSTNSGGWDLQLSSGWGSLL
jgi:hypothetical protein